MCSAKDVGKSFELELFATVGSSPSSEAKRLLALLLLLGFSVIYYFGPNVEQKFKFVTPGSAVVVILFALSALGFQVYVNNFSNYSATYGSLGAVIILMLFLYIFWTGDSARF